MKDLRDPFEVAAALEFERRQNPGAPLSVLADKLPAYRLPLTRGDESPLDRYGDPRDYEVEVETVIRRIPRKLTSGEWTRYLIDGAREHMPIEKLGEAAA